MQNQPLFPNNLENTQFQNTKSQSSTSNSNPIFGSQSNALIMQLLSSLKDGVSTQELLTKMLNGSNSNSGFAQMVKVLEGLSGKKDEKNNSLNNKKIEDSVTYFE